MQIVDGIKCLTCDGIIPFERLEVVDTMHCVHCADKKVKKYRGALNFGHKTGGTIMVMTDEFYQKEWKRYNPSFGRGSGVHKLSPAHRTR
jgi:hypothetical protein